MKRKNERSLDVIAHDINRLERANIFDIGGLLIEAKAQCEHGEWLPWLSHEFSWSTSTAERKMRVAELGGKFPKLTNLKLGATTLYGLADHDNEDNLPAIIDELAKHATKRHLRAGDAERVIRIGIGRRRFGDRPGATLVRLVELNQYDDKAWHEGAVAALLERNPETDDDADSIVNDIVREHLDAELDEAQRLRDEIEHDIDGILDGSPPDLPPPSEPPEPQKIGSGTTWAEQELFDRAVRDLLWLRTKPIARLICTFSSEQLIEVRAFLLAVAHADHEAKSRAA